VYRAWLLHPTGRRVAHPFGPDHSYRVAYLHLRRGDGDDTTVAGGGKVEWCLGLQLNLKCRVPHPCRRQGCAALTRPITNKLERRYGHGHLHFITCSCYRRQRFLGTARKRDVFLRVLDEVRAKYQFYVVGYVVMPEHVHLLISEPKIGTPSTVTQVLKQRVSRSLRRKRRRGGANQLRLWTEGRAGGAPFNTSKRPLLGFPGAASFAF
jgi:REP element-mobilizing transposase RayT